MDLRQRILESIEKELRMDEAEMGFSGPFLIALRTAVRLLHPLDLKHVAADLGIEPNEGG